MVTLVSLLYVIAIVVCCFAIYSNIKKQRQYKKQNMQVLYTLNTDGKTIRYLSQFFLIFMIITSAVALWDAVYRTGLLSVEAIQIFILPIIFIVLYVPLSQKTKITTIGIDRGGNMIKWNDIKGIDYLKPDSKGRIKAKILHKTSYKDMVIELVFAEKDGQLEQFRQTAKEYRNIKPEKIGKVEKVEKAEKVEKTQKNGKGKKKK